VYAVDTGFQRDHFDAAYLVVEAGRAAFVDTGTNFAVPRLLQALTGFGLTPEAVDWVIPTHVHLDHAGGVGPRRLLCHRAESGAGGGEGRRTQHSEGRRTGHGGGHRTQHGGGRREPGGRTAATLPHGTTRVAR
jgi:glyoxylase-like metal-dependent hydrolase (beta-lactamase superfamily II)